MTLSISIFLARSALDSGSQRRLSGDGGSCLSHLYGRSRLLLSVTLAVPLVLKARCSKDIPRDAGGICDSFAVALKPSARVQ